MSKFYENLCYSFIRPTRQIYTLRDLGPSLNANTAREDFTIKNMQNKNIECSHYSRNRNNNNLTCVVYVHSMNGSRLESTPIVNLVLDQLSNSSFCSFDCAGSGNSQGEYVSLGYFQYSDLCCVLKHLNQKFGIRNFILWGRSMGASTVIRLASRYESFNLKNIHIKGLIVDSPFCSLKTLAIQIAQSKMKIPQFLLKTLLIPIEAKIYQLANFKISSLELHEECHKINFPILFLASKSDRVIKYEHSVKLFSLIQSKEKYIKYIPGDHNDERNREILDYVLDYCRSLEYVGRQLEKKKSLKEDLYANRDQNRTPEKISQRRIPLFLASNQYKSHKIFKQYRNLSSSVNIKNSMIVQRQKYQKKHHASILPHFSNFSNPSQFSPEKPITKKQICRQAPNISSQKSQKQADKNVQSPRKTRKITKMRNQCTLNKTPQIKIHDVQNAKLSKNVAMKISQFSLEEHSPEFGHTHNKQTQAITNNQISANQCSLYYQQKLKKLKCRKKKITDPFFSEKKINASASINRSQSSNFMEADENNKIKARLNFNEEKNKQQIVIDSNDNQQLIQDNIEQLKQQESRQSSVNDCHLNIITQKLNRNNKRKCKVDIATQQKEKCKSIDKLLWKSIGETKIKSMHILPQMKFMPTFKPDNLVRSSRGVNNTIKTKQKQSKQ